MKTASRAPMSTVIEGIVTMEFKNWFVVMLLLIVVPWVLFAACLYLS